MTYVRPRRRITRQSRWRDLSDFKLLRIFMARACHFVLYLQKIRKAARTGQPLGAR